MTMTKLSELNSGDIKAAMSIAGEPDKVIAAMDEILVLISNKVDTKNIPSLDNMQFALQRIIAELKKWEYMERQRQGIKRQL